MRTLWCLIAFAWAVGSAAPAAAQIEIEDNDTPTPPTTLPANEPLPAKSMERPDMDPPGDIPRRPVAATVEVPAGTVVARGPLTKATYPQALIDRPLVLLRDQAQASLEIPFVPAGDEPYTTEVLRARYGVDGKLEFGLTYGFGLERFSPQPGEAGYEPGKAFSLDAAYAILPMYVAATAHLAMLVDPNDFGLAIGFGAPWRVPLIDKLALFGGNDVLRLKLVELAVDPADPEATALALEGLQTGVQPSAGWLKLDVGALYQWRQDTAFFTTIALEFPDLSNGQVPTQFSLFAGGAWSWTNRVDLGGKIGWENLADGGSFSISLYGAVRI